MKTIDDAAPEGSRACVKFGEGEPGMIISGEKLRQDAEVFRQIATAIETGRTKEFERSIGALRSMADQYEMAANGEEPRAK